MPDLSNLGCPEDFYKWVPSGSYLSLERDVPPEVMSASSVPGVNMVYLVPDPAVVSATGRFLQTQSFDVQARTVLAGSSASAGAQLDLTGAITLADTLRLPVRLSKAQADGSSDRFLLPIDAAFRPVAADAADHVLVLPERHLIADYPDAATDTEVLARIRDGAPMLSQLRWNGTRVEVGLPQQIVGARFADLDLSGVPAEQLRPVEGGIRGLLDEIIALVPHQGVRIRATTDSVTEDIVAVRASDGIALLHEAPTGTVAATLPRHPITLRVSPPVTIPGIDARVNLPQPPTDPLKGALDRSIAGMLGSLQLIPVGSTGQEDVGPRAVLKAHLEATRSNVGRASGADLEGLRTTVEQLSHGFFSWRQVLADSTSGVHPQSVRSDSLPARPEWHAALAAQVGELHERLTHLPTDQRDASTQHSSSPLGIVWTRNMARQQLVHATGRLEAALFALDGGQHAPWVLTDFDAEVDEARRMLTNTLVEIGKAVESRDVPVTELASPSDSWEPREKFAPPLWLVPDGLSRASLGAEDQPADFTDALITKIKSEIVSAFYQFGIELKPAELGSVVTRAALLTAAADVIGDEWTFEVQGHSVAVSLALGRTENGWRQVSDAVEMRGKQTTSLAGRHSRGHGHMNFLDTNTNLSWYLGHKPELVKKGFTMNEAYAGLATIIWSEHEEANTLSLALSSERTIKNSSYISYLFAFDATVNIRVTSPDNVQNQNVDRQTAVPGAVKIFVSRETARPLDAAATDFSEAKHPIYGAPTYAASTVAADAPIKLPRDSAVQTFSGVSEIRQMVEEYVADLAKPGSPEHKRLLAGLKPKMMVAGSFAAATKGYEIVFGDIAGHAPSSVTIHFVPVNPRVIIESDDATWMDIDDQTSISHNSEQVAADGFDIPPGLLLQAFGIELLPVAGAALPSVAKLEPYLFAWPTLDAVRIRSGPSLDVSDLSGVRFTGERTAVVAFDVNVWLERSDRPNQLKGPSQLAQALHQRVLREDAKQWADLATLAGDVDSQSLSLQVRPGQQLSAVTRIADLTLHSPGQSPAGPRQQPLVEAVLALIRAHYPGLVVHEDGAATHYAGRWSSVADARMALENTRRVRDQLNEDSAASLIRRAQGAAGVAFALSRKGISGRGGDQVVVRIMARRGQLADDESVTFEDPRYVRWLPLSEADANKTSNQDLITTSIKDPGIWAGLQPMLALVHVSTKVLKSLQIRPIVQGKYGKATQVSSGLATWGMHGISVDDEAQFTGPVVFLMQLEGPGTATPLNDQPWPGSVTPALPVIHRARPVTGTYTMSIPSDLTLKAVAKDGQSTNIPYSLDLPSLKAAGVASFAGDDGTPLRYRPTADKPLPSDTPLFLTADTLVSQVIVALTEMVHGPIPLELRLKVEQLLGAGLDEWLPWHSVGDQAGGPAALEIYDGPISATRGASQEQTKATIGMRLVFEDADGFQLNGLPLSFGTYSDMGVAAVNSTGLQVTKGFWGGLRMRFPLNIHKKLRGIHIDQYSYQPQLAQRREKTVASEVESAGSSGRLHMNVSRMALAAVNVHVEVSIETRVERNVAGKVAKWALPPAGAAQRALRTAAGVFGSWGQAVASFLLPSGTGGNRTVSVPAVGQTAFDALDATELGLMPPQMALHYDKTVTYVLPSTLRHGLGGGSVAKPPVLSGFLTQVVQSVEQRYGHFVAKAVRQDIGKLGGPAAGGAVVNTLLGGGVRIEVPVSEYLRAWGLPILPGTRTITVMLQASPIGGEYLGVAPSLHRLGNRAGSDTTRREAETRDSRTILDYMRGWFVTEPDGANSMLVNLHGDLRGITKRSTTQAEHQELSTGLIQETGRSGDGLVQWANDNGIEPESLRDVGSAGGATFDVRLRLTAKVTVETAPTAVADAATSGAFQTEDLWWVAQDDDQGQPNPDYVVTTRVKFDPRLLQQAVSDVAPEMTAPAAVAPVTAPTFDLPAGQSLADQRIGLEVDPTILARAREGLIFGIGAIRDHVTHLATPEAVTAPLPLPEVESPFAGLIVKAAQGVASLWQNYVWSAPPGSSWFHPKSVIADQIFAIINPAFLANRLPELLTTGITERILLPRYRFYHHFADLELHVDPIEVTEHGITHDVMDKSMQATTVTDSHTTTSSAGHAFMPWINPDFALTNYEYYDGPGTASMGVLQGADIISRHDESAGTREKKAASGGVKTTGGSYTTLEFRVRWLAAIKPTNPPGGKLNPYGWLSPQYIEIPDGVIRLPVPTNLKHEIMASPRRFFTTATPTPIVRSTRPAPAVVEDLGGHGDSAGAAETAHVPLWPLKLPATVDTRDGLVHVIPAARDERHSSLINNLATAAAAVQQPVILLNQPTRQALPSALADLNYLLEQYAQRGQLPIVVTTMTSVLSQVIEQTNKYGAVVLHPAPAAGLRLDNEWTMSPPEHATDAGNARLLAGQSLFGRAAGTSGWRWDNITPEVLRTAGEQARKTPAVAVVDDMLANLIWAANLTKARDVLRENRQRWTAQWRASSLAQVEKMLERVPNQPELSVFAPVLEFEAKGQADIVFDYALAEPADQPRVLIEAVNGLEGAGKLNPTSPLDGGLTTVELQSMVTRVGGPDVAKTMLQALQDIKTDFGAAEAFVLANKDKLDLPQKEQWVGAIALLSEYGDQQKAALTAAVFEC